MKLNLHVRAKNVMFWINCLIAVMVPVLTYLNMEASSLTSWPKVWELIVTIVSNPIACFLVVVNVLNTFIDQTTPGISDSKLAMNYQAPGKLKEGAELVVGEEDIHAEDDERTP